MIDLMRGRWELRLPNLDLPGVPITACTWHANAGDCVIEGDRLLEVLAGDAIVDLPAPASGKLLERKVQPDDPLTTGQVLAIIAAEDD